MSCSRANELGFVSRPVQLEIVPAFDAALIQNGPIENIALQEIRELGDCRVLHHHFTEHGETEGSETVRVTGAFGQLRSFIRGDDFVD